MSNAIGRYLGLAWQTAGDYMSAGCTQGGAWVGRNWSWACAQLPYAGAFMQRHAYGVCKAGRVFVSNHKWGFTSAAVIVVWAIVHYIRRNPLQVPSAGNTPQGLSVRVESSLNTARLVIDAPKQKEQDFQGTFHFCVDISESMNDRVDGLSRIERVKIAMKQIVSSALDEAKGSGKVFLSITVFNTAGTTLLKSTRLTLATVQDVLEEIKKIRCDGATDILAGLGKTTTVMEGKQEEGCSTAILLTDGAGGVSEDKLRRIKGVFANQSTELVVIGIRIKGQKDKATLEKIAANDVLGFRGQYIDVPDETKVGQVVEEVYRNRVNSFSQIKLTVPQFPLGKWQVEGSDVVPQDNGATFQLGALPAGQSRIVFVMFDGTAFPFLLDLAKVQLLIVFTDPKGRRGTIQLPWNPSPIVDPAILNRSA